MHIGCINKYDIKLSLLADTKCDNVSAKINHYQINSRQDWFKFHFIYFNSIIILV
jgi:hypothetical protein